MNIMVLNCGSSSLKDKIIAMPGEVELAGGEAQRVSPKTTEPSRIIHRVRGKESTHIVPMKTHAEAFGEVMNLLKDNPELKPDCLGHRVVHGGSRFKGSAMMDKHSIADLEKISGLAPLHNPPAVGLLKACDDLYPDLPQTAVFDTSFHATIPNYASTYALPEQLRVDEGIRKYGFHGTSHRFVVEEAARLMGKPMNKFNAVSCHLGSGGASLCAVKNGKSIDNTMGYSTLQGFLMSTLSGDLDSAIVLNLMAQHNGDPDAVENRLNKQSGVLGMSGISSDIRDIISRGDKSGDDAAQMRNTASLYVWRIRKYLGAYLSAVGNADAVIFTDTIGETMPQVRWMVCSDMEVFGLAIDSEKNDAAKELPADITAKESRVRIFAIATNEELAIARQTFLLLDKQSEKNQEQEPQDEYINP